MRTVTVALALFGLGSLITGCERQSQAAAPVEIRQIAWFKGTLDQALVEAKAKEKPLLIYWGAVWCPYCQALPKTVFTRPDFIEKTSFFVPVYLDGDLPGAQAWGETLKVSGYPTLLVLRPDRTEIARISGGMDLTEYATLLDDALQDERPIMAVLANPHTAEECRRLAYAMWDPDALDGTDAAKLTEGLTVAAARCHGSDQVRLEVLALSFALPGKAEDALLGERVRHLNARLENPAEVRETVDLIASLDDSLYALVKGLGPDFTVQFRERFVARLREASDNPSLAEADRLMMLASALDATKALSPEHTIPAPMQAAAHARIQAALAPDHDRAARGDLVNAARIMLEVMGDSAGAYDLLLKELPNTKTPYYYMSHLASIYEERGKPQDALAWLAKAYAASSGPATRLRWGSSYVRGLLRLAPDDTMRIRAAALQVIGEIGDPKAAQGRMRAPVTRLTEALEKWATSPKRRAVAHEITARLAGGAGTHAG